MRPLRAIGVGAFLALAFLPASARSDSPTQGPFVPAALRAAAEADPGGLFRVIIQGRRGSSSQAVAADVGSERAHDRGRERGTRRRFQSLIGVSAELTGRQVLRLARWPRLLAITPDAPLKAADLPTDPPPVDPPPPPPPVAPPPPPPPPPPVLPPPTVVTPPTIRGTAAWRQTLSVNPGVWQTTGLQPFVYQWQRCDASAACSDLPGATGSDYRVVDTDVGSTIRVVVTATDANGTAAAASLATPVVVAYASSQMWPYSLGLDRLWPATPVVAADPAAPAIAVVDSGVDSWSAGLGTRLVHQETLTTLPGNSSSDGSGHGTFVAGLAAGASARYAGAAPTARIVSLDVMDDNGMAMTSDVIAAADWIVAHKAEYGIRVANFSLIGSAPSSFMYDPLDKAVERLWLSGVVVVTASGNYATNGADSGVLYAPGNDPFVVTVGAADNNGSVDPANALAAPWSAYGHTPDGFAKPELGAPGRYLVAGIPSGSALAQAMPERIVEPGYLQLSGTSFATAVASGVAAALLEQHPGWTPDQVKGALMAGARQTSAGPLQLGVGEIDAAGAAAVADPPNPNAGLNAYLTPDPTGGPIPGFDAEAWRAAALADPAWAAVSWGVVSWGVVSWGVVSWGVGYWSPPAAVGGRGAVGASEGAWAPSDGSAGDFLPAGGYWFSPSGAN